ncbi:MAG: hypothetical protein VW338_00240 [Rhodospirillaceae bacterium]
MSRTLLQEVNAVLKKASVIQGSTGELSSLTDSALQVDIDLVVKAWNRVLLDLFRAGVKINTLSTGTLTLVTDTREYAVPSDYVEIADPVFLDNTLGNRLTPFPGGYTALRQHLLIPGNYTGLPNTWVINPTNNNIMLDNLPTSGENGRAYSYIYRATGLLSAAADTFVLRDDAVEAMEDAVEQMYARHKKGQFDQGAYQLSIAAAAQVARQTPAPGRYGVVRY